MTVMPADVEADIGADWHPLPDELADLSPSRTVAYILLHELEAATVYEVRDAGTMAEGTVYMALNDLVDHGLAIQRRALDGGYKHYYEIADGDAGGER